MTTKTVLITGASSGIGFQTAKLLAQSGNYYIILHARDTHKTKQAITRLQSQLPPYLHTKLESKAFDLTNPSAISDFCKQAQDRGAKLDILINNAGIMACPKTIITRGKHSWEAQLLVNHLSHYLLTRLLFLPYGHTNKNTSSVPQNQCSRIVHVSSAAHLIGSIDYQDPCFLTSSYNPWAAYGQSKLAQCMFSKHLYDIYGLESNSLHPGIAPTMLIRYVLPSWMTSIGGNNNNNNVLDESGWVKAAARRVVNVACDESSKEEYTGGGRHFYSPVAKVVGDEKECEKLWNLSAELVDAYL